MRVTVDDPQKLAERKLQCGAHTHTERMLECRAMTCRWLWRCPSRCSCAETPRNKAHMSQMLWDFGASDKVNEFKGIMRSEKNHGARGSATAGGAVTW